MHVKDITSYCASLTVVCHCLFFKFTLNMQTFPFCAHSFICIKLNTKQNKNNEEKGTCNWKKNIKIDSFVKDNNNTNVLWVPFCLQKLCLLKFVWNKLK